MLSVVKNQNSTMQATNTVSQHQIATVCQNVTDANKQKFFVLVRKQKVGSPTQGGRPTPALLEFLNKIPDNSLNNINISAFDTRFAKDEHGFGLKVLMNTIGFAAEKIAKSLQNKGGTLVVPAEGFIVTGREGPLKKGELERAAEWAREIAKKKNRVMH